MSQISLISDFIRLLNNKFQAKLETKTGWGKNELWNAYQSCQLEALAEAADIAPKISNKKESKDESQN